VNFIQSLFGRKKEERQASGTRPTFTEKRKHQRWRVAESTFFYPQRRQPLQAQLLEISPGGARLELREPLPLETRGDLALYCGGVVSKATIILRWEIRQRTGYVYGAEFIDLDPRMKATVMAYIRLVTGQQQ